MNGSWLRGWFVLLLALGVVAALIPADPGWAQGGGQNDDDDDDDGEDDGEDENETPFDEASIFFELNDTDGDLGIHALVDGDAWRELEIEDPRERRLLSIWLAGRLRQQGLTELFFESAEPSFDELSPEKFFKRFPEGDYEISGTTLRGEELESVVEVSHVMPGPPQGVTINGLPSAEDCDADPLPEVSSPIVVAWDPVTDSHPEIGTPGVAVEVERYEFVIEGEDLEVSAELSSEVTEFEIPEDLVEPGDEVKFEIIVREENGNQTAVESCFIVE
jgi:hypothetical protein